MNYIALGLFCLWVLTEVLSGQGLETPAMIPAVKVTEREEPDNFAERIVETALYRATQKVRYDPR